MLMDFTLENVKHMADGTIAQAFEHHLKRAIQDAEDRPGNKKPRKITLEIDVVPVVLQDGACMEVEIEAKVKSKIPDHVSRPIECKIKHGGRAVFNDLSPDNPNQMTIDQ